MKIADTPSSLAASEAPSWWGGLMPDPNRECSILVKMSLENRALLHRDAARLGITLQALAERRMLGIADAQPLPNGRIPRAQKEELPLTG